MKKEDRRLPARPLCHPPLKLRGKLMLSYCALIFIWVLVFSLVFYRLTNSRVKRIGEQSVENAVTLSQQYLSAWFEETQRLSMILLQNRELQRIMLDSLDSGGSEPSGSYSQKFADYRTLSELIQNTRRSYNIQNLILYFARPDIFDSPAAGFGTVEDIQGELYCEKTFAAGGGVVWSGPHVQPGGGQALRLTRLVKSFDRISCPLGVMQIDLDEKQIARILASVEYNGQGTAYLVDEDNRILSASRPGLREDRLGAEQAAGEIQFTSPIRQTGWRIVYRIPARQLYREYEMLRNGSLLLLAAICGATLVLSAGFSRVLARRLSALGGKLAQMEQEDFSVRIQVMHRDEISVIEHSFNRMAARIHELFTIAYKAELAQKDAELKTLQSQISPHFLYNTLDTISWKAYIHGDLEVVDLVNKLGRFFRLTILTDELVIPLHEELAQLRAYLDIQKARYADRVTVDWQVQEDTLNCSIVKLTLQPLVENALVHGILPMESGDGLIRIGAVRLPEAVEITIADNGLGFSPGDDTIQPPAGRRQVGLRNIRQRLELLFGADGYSLDIRSKPQAGTTVTLKISQNYSTKKMDL